jgi:hypothetical protein
MYEGAYGAYFSIIPEHGDPAANPFENHSLSALAEVLKHLNEQPTPNKTDGRSSRLKHPLRVDGIDLSSTSFTFILPLCDCIPLF